MLDANILFIFTNKYFEILFSMAITKTSYNIVWLIGIGVLQDFLATSSRGGWDKWGEVAYAGHSFFVCFAVVLYLEKAAPCVAKADLENS